MNKAIIELLEVSRKHGKFAMPEACRLIIYTLFLQYIDFNRERMPSYDEKFSVRYLARLYGELVKLDEVVEYVKKIEKDLIPGDGLVSAELENLLQKADDSYVQILFKTIDKIGFEEAKLYETAAALLDTVAYAHGSGTGNIPTSLSLSRLEGRLLGCRDGMSVYDGVCGYGLSVNEAADGRGVIYIQDTEKELVAIAAVLAVLRGNQIGAARTGDSLTGLPGEEKYDRIIMEPPFNFKGRSGDSMPAKDSEILALRHALDHLADDGIAVVLIPAGMLFKKGKYSEIRKELVDSCLDAVIELPSGVVPSTRTATALLVLKKNREKDAIFMANAKDFFEKSGRNQLKISDENISRLAGLYEKREKEDGVSSDQVEEAVMGKEYNLCTSQYVISDPQSKISIGDVAAYRKKYKQLAKQLAEVDRQLHTVRGRFL